MPVHFLLTQTTVNSNMLEHHFHNAITKYRYTHITHKMKIRTHTQGELSNEIGQEK